ncbi:hypothetical protein [Hymenobacter weizhouensis]|uniref:hypothetical protein n=1 Tax=Hymenobacter sp. YIM 151500-1 TaxID=2987689 RepID=UPI002227E2D4|nr:hypothetical protein [Hymenobacter sp. YIM 151500-1]UYZ64939.1 hypothetical protein OIS53_08820 [Hymenobacter sp. YIM 151500-1]
MSLFDSPAGRPHGRAAALHQGRDQQPTRKPTGRAAALHQGRPAPPPAPSGRAAALHSGAQATGPDWGDFRIKIYVRSFAPPQYFALHNWLGDNRGFSTSTSGETTSRLAANTIYHVATQRYSTIPRGSRSVALYGGYILEAASDAYVSGGSAGDGSGRGSILDIHLYGNDKAVLPYVAETPAGRYQSPDIDVHVSLNITTKNLRNGTHLLTIAGQMKGDQFPAAECFVDVRGVKIFLGVSPARYNPEFNGPFLALFGDRKANMATLSAQIIVNGYGDVMGMLKHGRVVDVEQHNRPFFDKNPVDKGANAREMKEMMQSSPWSPAIHW